MSMVVQHNLQAMNSNRMLGITTGAQSKSTEKLSSGYRINRAADDAAGLTISEKMRKQMRGLDRASTNAQDGVSAVQTAEGALTEVHSMLQRMNELAVQAANGTNSESDRKAIQDEINQLSTEIDRVAETTKFNEIYLLKGDGEAPTKTVSLEAHDAGLKGKLIDNGDGTATFKMDELKAGDTVSIGGKTYKIAGGAADDEEEETKTAAGQTDAQAAVTAAFSDAGLAANDTIKVGAATYTYDGTDWKDDAGTTVAAAADIVVAAGDTVEINIAGATPAASKYTTGAELADAQAAVTAAFSDAGLAANDTIKVGTATYTYDGTDWKDDAGTTVAAAADIIVAAGDTVEINIAATGVSKYFTEPEAAEEEPAAKTTDEISLDEAYELARKALEAANKVGDTNESSSVKFGAAEAEEGTEATADDFNVGDKKTIGGTEYTVGVAVDDVSGKVDDAIQAEITASGITGPANTNNGTAAVAVGTLTIDGTDYYVWAGNGGAIAYSDTNTAPVYAGGALAAGGGGNMLTQTQIDAAYAAAKGKNVTFTPDAAGNAATTMAIADDDTDGSTVVSAAKMADLVNNPPADGAENAGTPSNVFEITVGSVDVASTLSFNLHVGSDADMTNKISVNIDTMNSEFLGIKNLDVIGAGNDGGISATYAIDAIADAIAKVSEQRSALGAVQNRLEHTIANLDNVVENTTAAESRIRDTDMAEEMVEYSKNNILAQAGQSMLAQANQSTQGVLSLLG